MTIIIAALAGLALWAGLAAPARTDGAPALRPVPVRVPGRGRAVRRGRRR